MTTQAPRSPHAIDPREPVSALMRDLRTGPDGLASREAARRLDLYGSNELPLRRGRPWWSALGRQFSHPLALLLWVAAALAAGTGATSLGIAILVVIVLNAVLAFWQENQAEHAVAALGRFLPDQVWVMRDHRRSRIHAGLLVRGDVLLVEEGERIPADARLIDGTVEVDMSALTGESDILTRSAAEPDHADRSLDSPVLIFSGTACVSGTGRALVYGTGVHTELGRIAALSQHVRPEESPLEHQVRRVAWRDWDADGRPEPGNAERELHLVGLVGLLDPPRPEVPAAVRAVHDAGVRVHVITGDNGRTAAEVARRIGLGADRVVDGTAIDTMTDERLDPLLAEPGEVVFARTTPEMKLRIADALRHNGEVVAMTGDGVNDAPALRRADIGVAMGAAGTAAGGVRHRCPCLLDDRAGIDLPDSGLGCRRDTAVETTPTSAAGIVGTVVSRGMGRRADRGGGPVDRPLTPTGTDPVSLDHRHPSTYGLLGP